MLNGLPGGRWDLFHVLNEPSLEGGDAVVIIIVVVRLKVAMESALSNALMGGGEFTMPECLFVEGEEVLGGGDGG